MGARHQWWLRRLGYTQGDLSYNMDFRANKWAALMYGLEHPDLAEKDSRREFRAAGLQYGHYLRGDEKFLEEVDWEADHARKYVELYKKIAAEKAHRGRR